MCIFKYWLGSICPRTHVELAAGIHLLALGNRRFGIPELFTYNLKAEKQQ